MEMALQTRKMSVLKFQESQLNLKDVQTVTEMVFKIMTTNVQKLQGQLIMRAAQE
jgi:hypothetical protein